MAARSWAINLKLVPRPLWGYVALTLASAVAIWTRSPSIRLAIFSVVFLVAWDYFLLRGVRWLWLVTIAGFALSFVVDLATGSGTWWVDGIGVLQLCLLLLPPTRRFFNAQRSSGACMA